MRKWLSILAAVLLLTWYAPTWQAQADAPVRVMVVSDTHYLSPSLFADSDLFLRALERGDGKVTMYAAQLLAALMEEARHQQPDCLIITGDLTFNGEKISHEELASAMRQLVTEGIPVVVIPGNHDINNASAARYVGAGYIGEKAVTPGEFMKIWEGMTADVMLGPGASGVVCLSDKVWLVMGDYSIYETEQMTYGNATDEHIAWLEQVLTEASKNGVTVISASHQNMTAHTDFMTGAYTVWHGDRVARMLAEAGCQVNLSGHMHLQHIRRGDVLTDIATGAWTISPHRYGIVTVGSDGTVTYQAEDVCAEHLPAGLKEATREFFHSTTVNRQSEALKPLGLSPELEEMLAFYAADVNEAYFSGTLAEHPELREHPALAEWAALGDQSSFGSYLTHLLEEEVENALTWSSAPTGHQ